MNSALCLSVMNFFNLEDAIIQNMRSLDWLKFVLVLTQTSFLAFRAFCEPTVIITLVSPFSKFSFLLFVMGLPGACTWILRLRRRESKTEARGAAAGPFGCQGLAAGFWGSSRHLVHTGAAQLVKLLTGRAWLPSSPK